MLLLLDISFLPLVILCPRSGIVYKMASFWCKVAQRNRSWPGRNSPLNIGNGMQLMIANHLL